MSKRIGANGRKKRDEKATAPRSPSRRRFLLPAFLAVLAAAAGVALFPEIEKCVVQLKGRLERSGERQITTLVIRGTTHCSGADLLARSGVLLPAALRRIRRDFCDAVRTASPWVRTARVAGVRGDTAVIEINERRPVALVEKGRIFTVDAEGTALPFDPAVSKSLPLVSGLADSAGNDGLRRLTGDACGRLNRLLRSTAGFDTAFAAGISQAHFRPDGSVLLVREGSATVIIIDDRDLPQRLRLLAQVLERVQGAMPPPASIDLSYQNLAFVKSGTAGAAVAAEERTVRKNRG